MPENFSDPVWHFKLGKCAIVTSRIYAIIAFVLFAIGSGYYIYCRPTWDLNSNPLFHHNIESKVISTSWPDFLNDCGGSAIIENQVHAKMQFNDKYENNIINWSGYFVEVKQRHVGYVLFGTDHHISILVKMAPSESEKFADLVLSVGTEEYESNKKMYDGLKKGEEISFSANFLSMGNEFKMHHLHAQSVRKTGQSIELGDI